MEAQRDADWERVKLLVEALINIGKMPCITELLGDILAEDDRCGCARCIARAALAQFEEAKP